MPDQIISRDNTAVTDDMLPEASKTDPVVTPPSPETVREDVKPPASDVLGPKEDAPETPDTPPVPTGHVPYSRFKEVNEELKQAKAKLKDLEASPAPSEPEVEEEPVEDDEEKEELRNRVNKLEDSVTWSTLIARWPVLADKREELDEYRDAEHPKMGLESVAKLFVVDRGLNETAPVRKGLEKPSGGPRTPPGPKYTQEQEEDLRKNQPKKWLDLNNAGAFDDLGWK